MSRRDMAARYAVSRRGFHGVGTSHHTSGGYQDDAQRSAAMREYAKAHDTSIEDLEIFFETGKRPKKGG